MNLTDLRDELAARADDVTPSPHLAPGVHGRVRAVRRRRAAAAASATCAALVLAGVAVASSVTGRAPAPVPAGPARTATTGVGDDGLPSRTVPVQPGDVVRDGLRLLGRDGDDRLLAGAIGVPGAGSLTVPWTPSTRLVSYVAECYTTGGESPTTAAEADPNADVSTGGGSAGPPELRVRLQVGSGGEFYATSCGGPSPADGLASANRSFFGDPGKGDSRLDLGVPTTLTAKVVDASGTPVTGAPVRVVVAAYALGTQRLVRDADGRAVAALPEVLEHAGYRYRLGTVASAPATDRSLPSADVPGGPSLVTWGSAAAGGQMGAAAPDAALRLTGVADASEGRSYGTWGQMPVPDGAAAKVALATEGGAPPKGATAFIGVYSLER